jgi:hypothetical protein
MYYKRVLIPIYTQLSALHKPRFDKYPPISYEYQCCKFWFMFFFLINILVYVESRTLVHIFLYIVHFFYH